MSFPSLERQFSLNSKETGFIASSNDVTAIILVIFVSFFGSYGNKTKWLGGGAILTGLGALVFALPKFLAPIHDPTGGEQCIMVRQAKLGGTPFCLRNTSLSAYEDPDCGSATENAPILYYALFIISQLMSGAGTTPLHTLGPAYLDENLPSDSLSVYLAILYMATFMGPGVGSLIGGQLLTVFVEITMVRFHVVGVSNDGKMSCSWYIGAWWLGPLAAGLGVMVCGVIILGFPRHLPGAYTVRKEALRSGEMKKDDSHLKGNIRDILPATKNLLMNRTYIFQNLAKTFGVSCFDFSSLAGFGLFPFMYKVISERYGAGSLLTGVMIAVLLVPSVSLGLLIGNYLVRRLRIRRSCHRPARLAFFLQILGIWGALSMLIPGCPCSNYAGVDVAYGNRSSQKIALGNPCNVGCLCSAAQYSPVNGGEGVTFFSPCYAGCPPQKPTKGYSNCSCNHPQVSAPDLFNTTGHLSPGIYREHCSKKYLMFYAGACIVSIVLAFSNQIPSKLVSLRSVPDDLRAYGLGLQFVFMRTLGALPGPVIVGTIIDHTCTLWKTKCGKPANCLNYD
ncbi:predicted protein, partial [Nematostella vectensis]